MQDMMQRNSIEISRPNWIFCWSSFANHLCNAGTPLCPFASPTHRREIEYNHGRTKFACYCTCLDDPHKLLFPCKYQNSESRFGWMTYNYFKGGYRRKGQAVPGSRIYRRLKKLRTGIERYYGFTKENRYQMETNNTYMGHDNVLNSCNRTWHRCHFRYHLWAYENRQMERCPQYLRLNRLNLHGNWTETAGAFSVAWRSGAKIPFMTNQRESESYYWRLERKRLKGLSWIESLFWLCYMKPRPSRWGGRALESC